MKDFLNKTPSEEAGKALKQAVESLQERCGVVVSIEALAALCVETTVANGQLDELLDKLVLEHLKDFHDIKK